MENPLIICISTPEENYSQIALVEVPGEDRKKNRTDTIQHILSIADCFWMAVGGIIWNGTIQPAYIDGRNGFSIELPNTGIEYSPIDSKSFPGNWDNVRRQAYIMEQVHRIMKYGATNPLYLSKGYKWSNLKLQRHTTKGHTNRKI